MEIIRGKKRVPIRVVIYGPEGVGKSTLAAACPNPLFIDTEGSTEQLDVARTPTPTSWAMLMSQVSELRKNSMGFQSVVVDTTDWAQRLCVNEILAEKTLDGIEGMGYGKGYTYLAERFAKLLDALSDLRDAGMHVILTAHATTRKFELPEEEGSFDKWEMKLEKKVGALVKEWADMVLFCGYKTLVITDDKTKKSKAHGAERVIRTQHTATWDAKNRFGLAAELPMVFASIAQCFTTAPVAASPVAPPAETYKPVAPHLIVPAPSLLSPEDAQTLFTPMRTITVPVVSATTWPNTAQAQLDAIMAQSGVTYDDLLGAIVAQGHFPTGTPKENLPDEYILGRILPNWEKVLKNININKAKGL